MQLFRTQRFWLGVLIFVLLTQSVSILILGLRQRSLSHSTDAQFKSITSVAEQAVNASSYIPIRASIAGNAVYIPELRLKLPLNDTTLAFEYSLRADSKDKTQAFTEADITTRDLVSAAPVDATISCSNPVRIKYETSSNPYNPHETNVVSVKLANGKTLQVYAFHHTDCSTAFNLAHIDSDALGKVFKQAVSY